MDFFILISLFVNSMSFPFIGNGWDIQYLEEYCDGCPSERIGYRTWLKSYKLGLCVAAPARFEESFAELFPTP